jgi:hypothetical protein
MESLIIIESSDELDATSGRHLVYAVDAASRSTPTSVAISLRNMKKIRWNALCSFVQDVQRRREAGLDVRLIDALPRIERLLEAATRRADCVS